MSGDLDSRMAAAEQTVTELQAEQRNLPDQLKEAAASGDPHLWIKLHARADDIGEDIRTARIEVARLRLEAARAGVTDAEAEHDRVIEQASADRKAAKQRVTEADEALRQAQDDVLAADRRARDARNIVPRALRVQQEAEEALAALSENPTDGEPPRPVLARTVTVTEPGSSQRVTFHAGQTPPRWVREVVTSPNAWQEEPA